MRISSLSKSALQLGASIAAVLGLLSGVVWVVTRPETAVDRYACPADPPAPSHTVLLIDVTDPLSSAQMDRLMTVTEEAGRRVPRRGRMTVFLLSPDSPWEPRRILSVCSPGRGSEADVWTETGQNFETEWRARFVAPLRAAAARLGSQPSSDSSPIIESLTAIASREDFDVASPGRRLIYLGDGLQHSAGSYSHYGSRSDVAAYERSTLAQDAEVDLRGVDVEFHYMRRPEAAHLQGARHKAFWKWWFESRRATVRFRGA